MNETKTLNNIEKRIKNKKRVTQKEINLLLESYIAFNVKMPEFIKEVLK